MKPNFFLALCSSLLAGCASVGPEACAKTDWYLYGYIEAQRTWYSRIEEHTARCAPAKPDAAQYERGFEQGKFDKDTRFGRI